MLFTKEYWLNCIDRTKRYIKTFIKWIICSIIIGTTCGAVGTAFHYSVEYVTKYRDSHSWIIYLLPLAGLVIIFLYRSCGLKHDKMRARDHSPEELCFYSKGTTDIEFLFPFGWGELWGIADRTDYDLTQHQTVSGEPMDYFDDEKKEKYIPYVIEPSLGADRVTLAFLCAAYDEENIGTEEKPDVRTVLHFHPALAPVKIGVLPLSKKLGEEAEKVYAELCKYYNCEYDDRGNIGKRYRRQDEIGTPFCVTYDFDSEEDGAVTVRDRDTMEQERVKIEDLKAYFEKKFEY